MNTESKFVAALSEIPEGGNRAFGLDGKSILVCRARSGVYAVANRCSHADSPLEGGLIKGDHLFCPLHGARFELASGRCIGGPYSPLKTFAVRLNAGMIEVAVPNTPPAIENVQAWPV